MAILRYSVYFLISIYMDVAIELCYYSVVCCLCFANEEGQKESPITSKEPVIVENISMPKEPTY
jgi:hypothetical protein